MLGLSFALWAAAVYNESNETSRGKDKPSMKIYLHWHLEKAKVWLEGRGIEIEIKCYGGSNISLDDARQRALAKIEKVKRKLAGDAHAFDDYEVEIREEVIRLLDERTAITRNRYGALVLNAQDLMIMDIDRPPFSFWDLFRAVGKDAAKERIVARVRRLAQLPKYQYLGLRVYETKNGIRVIALGRNFDPRAAETQAILQEFNCDALYARLCQRQRCFRARLTPKPSNIG
ncbi:MAG: hypothetical protein N3A66_04285, partial [Planctomycetota bacterium]|nr:hypothetical protein [Planctomycetota bacterium]